MRPVAAPFSLPERYELKGPVASGGMASVWSARDTMLGRDVAVKVLAEHLSQDPSARERFQREARAAAGLSSHPGVVTIFDVGEHEGRSFIVMELLTGGTLAEVLARGRPRVEDAVRWLRDAAGAVDAAHAVGIVHRDIKPANLLLDQRGRLAVGDFGIARVAEDPSLTQTGTVLGTASYISPEQASGGQATPASDRYSLAVVAFELLTGVKPFESESFAAQARAHVETPPPAASSRAPELPDAVDGVLARGLAKDPDARWDSAEELVDALQAALGRSGADVPVAGPAATAATVPMAPTVPHPRRRRDFPLLAVAAALALLVGAAIVLGLAGGGGEEDGGTAAESTPAERREEPERDKQPEAEATRTPTAAPEATVAAGDPAALNARGFELFEAGSYAEAVPILQQAVDACGGSSALDPCGYALYNLGASLNRSGRPAEAIPVLQRRLDGWDDQEETVLAELQAACEASGQECEGLDDGGKSRGRGKGKGKD